MTSLLSWISVDSRSPSAIYFATDSRLTYEDGSHRDDCPKVFASSLKPDIFCVVGSAASIYIVREIRKVLDTSNLVGIHRLRLAHTLAQSSLSKLGPPMSLGTTICFATRMANSSTNPSICDFVMTEIPLDGSNRRVDHTHQPDTSRCLIVKGSGNSDVFSSLGVWRRHDSGGTSRALFSAFCDGIGATDPLSGGAPQLAGLYRTGVGNTFAVEWNGDVYVQGLPNTNAQVCFNRLFERCDPTSGIRLNTAQKHMPSRIS